MKISGRLPQMGDARVRGVDQLVLTGDLQPTILDRWSFPTEGTAMRRAILVVAVGAFAVVLASFTRAPQVAPGAPLASISHLEIMLTASSLPEAEASSTF